MRKYFIIFICGFQIISCTSTWAKKACSKDDAMKAEVEAASLLDWKSLYRSYKNFSHCDDGSVAEGYNVAVVRLLTQSWDQIDKLNHFIKSDKRFEHFIFRHINETMSREEQLKIIRNVKDECPSNLEKLCEMIETAALKQ